MANKFYLAVPVAKPSVMMEELADNEKAGGDVHMRLLTRIDGASIGFGCRASSTRKTVAHINGVQLHVAAGNFLCALSTSERQYLYIRNFEQAKARRGELIPGTPHKVKVQHGDVIVVHQEDTCPSFLKAKVDCTGLSREDCFERVKSFCHAAKDKESNLWRLWKAISVWERRGSLLMRRKSLAPVSKSERSEERRARSAGASRQRKSLAVGKGVGEWRMLGVIKISCRSHKWEDKNKGCMSALEVAVRSKETIASGDMGDAHEPSCGMLKAGMWMMKQMATLGCTRLKGCKW